MDQNENKIYNQFELEERTSTNQNLIPKTLNRFNTKGIFKEQGMKRKVTYMIKTCIPK